MHTHTHTHTQCDIFIIASVYTVQAIEIYKRRWSSVDVLNASQSDRMRAAAAKVLAAGVCVYFLREPVSFECSG